MADEIYLDSLYIINFLNEAEKDIGVLNVSDLNYDNSDDVVSHIIRDADVQDYFISALQWGLVFNEGDQREQFDNPDGFADARSALDKVREQAIYTTMKHFPMSMQKIRERNNGPGYDTEEVQRRAEELQKQND